MHSMKIFIPVFFLFLLGCGEKQDDSLLGKWQIMRLREKDSAGREQYVYDIARDTSRKYVYFLNDTSYHSPAGEKVKDDTIRYILTGDPIFSKRGIHNYALDMFTNDSALITGDDLSAITIVRVRQKK